MGCVGKKNADKFLAVKDYYGKLRLDNKVPKFLSSYEQYNETLNSEFRKDKHPQYSNYTGKYKNFLDYIFHTEE